MKSGKVTLRFTSRWPHNPISLVIALASGSRFFSHVVAIVDGEAFESSMTHGCRACTVADVMKGIVRYQDMAVDVPDIEAALAFARAQHGKPYDFAGALALPLLKSDDWGDESRWWCSELVFAMLMAGGVNLLDPDEVHRVTPNDLFQCYHPKTELMRA